MVFFCHILLTFCSLTKIQQSSIWSGPFSCKIISVMKVDENCLLFHVSHPRGSKWREINSLGSFKGTLRNKIDCVTTKREGGNFTNKRKNQGTYSDKLFWVNIYEARRLAYLSLQNNLLWISKLQLQYSLTRAVMCVDRDSCFSEYTRNLQ